MANFWIVTEYKYRMQPKLSIAEREVERLNKKHPKKKFTILRVKDKVQPDPRSREREAEQFQELREPAHKLAMYVMQSDLYKQADFKELVDEILEVMKPAEIFQLMKPKTN